MVELLEPLSGISLEEGTWISCGPEETQALGKLMGEKLRAGDVVALSGELGAGKTCLTQGIARGLGIPEEYPIVSPTFTIINEYPGRLTFYHMDMYRLSGPGELEEIGYEACLDQCGVIVVEWAEKIKEALPAGTLFIFITYLDKNRRRIILSRDRERANQLINAVDGG